MPCQRPWLERYSWDFVTGQNTILCLQKSALHMPTSDGHEKTKALWEQHYRTAVTLAEAVHLCRRCHKMAPFCFYNGNTFAAIIRDVIGTLMPELSCDDKQAFIIRSLAGHIVAGVASEVEVEAFQAFSDSLA